MRNMKTMKKHQYVRINTILLLLALSLLMISTNMFMIHARRRRRRNNMVDGTPSLPSKEVESLHNWPGYAYESGNCYGKETSICEKTVERGGLAQNGMP